VLIGSGEVGLAATVDLAGRCDVTYFVISRRTTKRRAAGEAVDALRTAGAKVVGCVLVGE
jgi:predicted NAD/FAD-binding protein